MTNFQLSVGCCGWTEAQAKYVQRFSSIELQTTFYQPPANPVVRRWKATAPPHFHFCIKAWQLITHTPASPTYRKLKSPISQGEQDLCGNFRDTEQVWLAWERTREIADILDARVVVFQCPKSFLPTRENIGNLERFFGRIERGPCSLAWEPRGEDWCPELVRELCAQHRLIHCVDPFLDTETYGDRLYWRLHGRTGYRYRYTAEDLQELRAKFADRARPDVLHYVMFNNMTSREDALSFRRGMPG